MHAKAPKMADKWLRTVLWLTKRAAAIAGTRSPRIRWLNTSHCRALRSPSSGKRAGSGSRLLSNSEPGEREAVNGPQLLELGGRE